MTDVFAQVHLTLNRAIDEANREWHDASYRAVPDRDQADRKARQLFALDALVTPAMTACLRGGVSLSEAEARLKPFQEAFTRLLYWHADLPDNPTAEQVRDRLAGRIRDAQAAWGLIHRMAGALDGGATDPGQTSPRPQWRGRAAEILLVMSDRGWTSPQDGVSQDAIARAVKRGANRRTFSSQFAHLRTAGLIVATGAGSRAGTHLTARGVDEARKLQERSE